MLARSAWKNDFDFFYLFQYYMQSQCYAGDRVDQSTVERTYFLKSLTQL